MSTFQIRLVSEERVFVRDVFMDVKDNWVMFRELTGGGPERLRVNADSIRYVEKMQEDD